MRRNINNFKTVIVYLLFSTLFVTAANADNYDSVLVKFRHLTIAQAKAASKAEKKPLFIHCYADWCGYCKYMKDSVYTDKDVADFYNKNFVCLALNIEKEEGVELNKTIMSHTFPTLLYYDTTGELMHRAAGRKYKQPFLDLGMEAMDPKRNMRYFKNGYENGTLTPHEVMVYFRMQEIAGMDAQMMLSDYLMKQPDSEFTNANNWRIMYDIIKNSSIPAVNRFLDNKKELERKYSTDSVNHKLIILYNANLMQYVQQLDSIGYDNLKKKILANPKIDIREKICANADLNKLKMKSDWDAYKVEGKKFIDKYATDDFRRLIDVSQVYYDHFNSDKELMAQAEAWLLKSVSIADLYKGNNLLASVYFALGKKDLALKTANHAIDLAKRDNVDYKQTSQLIDVIQKAP